MKNRLLSALELPLAFGLFIRSFSDVLATTFAGEIYSETNDWNSENVEYAGLTFQSKPLFWYQDFPTKMYYWYAILGAYWAYIFGNVGVNTLAHKGILYSPVGYLALANLLVVYWFTGIYFATAVSNTLGR